MSAILNEKVSNDVLLEEVGFVQRSVALILIREDVSIGK